MKKTLFTLLLISCINASANDNEIKITPVQVYNLGVKIGTLKVIEQIPLLYAPANFSGSGIHYWVLPVIEKGII